VADKVRVPNPWDMDRETFRQHFEKRHSDSLGGLASLTRNFDDDLWGRFHDQLHRWYFDYDHDHAAATDDEPAPDAA